MICPLCKHPKSRVQDTIKLMSSIKRIRQCLNVNCLKYFITNEVTIPEMIFDEPPAPEGRDTDQAELEDECQTDLFNSITKK